MTPWFDTRYDPLHVQVFPAEYTYEELDAGFTRTEQHYLTLAERNPHARVAIICDASRPQKSTARNRKRIASTIGTLGPVLQDMGVGQAFVMRSALMRHALTAIFWIKRPPWPVKVFTKHEEAVGWLRERFAAEGIVMPEPMPWWGDAGVSQAPPAV